ncbi:MAG: hypothetical protein ABI369_08365 [Acetobacteraceae bacterium]
MADPQPAPVSPSPQPPKETAPASTGGSAAPPNTKNAATTQAPDDETLDQRQAALREAVDKLQLALPGLQIVDKSLAQHVEFIARQASDPLRLNQRSFQHEIAYAAQDTVKALGNNAPPVSLLTASELSKLAGSAPGLESERVQALLQSNRRIDDRNLVRDIRRAGGEIGQQADQNTPAIRSQLDTLENRARLAPRIEVAAETAPTNSQPRAPQPEAPAGRGAAAPTAAETQQRQNGTWQTPNRGSFTPSSSANAVQNGMFRTLRSRGPFDTPPWEAGTQPFAERLTAFEAKMREGKEDITLRGAEKSARAAMDAMEGFETREGAAVMSRVRDAARSDPNGMAGVLSEMKDGGKFADLRQQFNNAVTDGKGFGSAYDKAASALARYGEDRKAVEQIIARRPDAANLSAKFETMDKEIGQAARELPSRSDGRSMIEDLSKQVTEMLQRAVDNVKNLFHRTAGASPGGPSPS